MMPVARASAPASRRSFPLSCMRRSTSASSCSHRWNVAESVSRASSSWSETSAATSTMRIPIEHEGWLSQYRLFGDDDDFARAVVTEEHAGRWVQIDIKAEWRFAADEFLLWIEDARVGGTLTTVLEVLRPLI